MNAVWSCGQRKVSFCRPRHKLPYAVLLIVLLFSLLGVKMPVVEARALAPFDNAYDLIAAVNQLRASNGLPPYEIDGALMAAAQAHSEYQASIGTITHTGSGGSDVKSRAIAAGYGGGADVFVVENIAGGGNMTPQGAVQIWQGDSLHLDTMLSTRATHVGAGYATSGSMAFYTLVVGSISGSPGSAPPPTEAASSGNPQSTQAQPGALPNTSIQSATPAPDGSITHEVQPGQALWNIAAIYGVSIDDLLKLNQLTQNAFIRPGDKILVKPADITHTEALTATIATEVIEVMELAANEITDTPTPKSGITDQPTSTLTTPLTQVSSGPTPILTQAASSTGPDPLLILISLLVFGGTVLIIVGNVLKRSA